MPVTEPSSPQRPHGQRRVTGITCCLAAFTLLGVLLAGTGCGAARESQPAASPATVAGPSASSAAAPPEAAPAAYPPADAAPSTPAAAAASGDNDVRAGASGEFERAARSVDAASSDCRQACRALASMDRACGQLCRLDADATCEGDKTRLRSARKRVRTSCGSCPDGTSVEPDGPIPQPR